MNTLFKLCSVFLFLFTIQPSALLSQCKDITVNLGSDGRYILSKQDILYPFYLTYDHISYSPGEFTCDDIGINEVDVLIYTSVDTFIHCKSSVTVRDIIPPVAKCFSNLHVVLDGQGQYEFAPQNINLQSTDECSEVGFRFFPSKVKCTDSNPINVIFVARDESGNLDTCQMIVTWEEYSGPTQDIACQDSVIFRLEWEEELMLTSDVVFEDILYGCASDYTLELFEGGNLRPLPIITFADTNVLLTATITDPDNGSQCSAIIRVLTNIYCEKPLPVCDVQCHSAPVGDCTSGHSLHDEVEWPCDITIDGACAFNELYPNPDILIWYGLADSADAYPTLGFDCLFKGFWDNELEFPNQKIVQRHWILLDWLTHKEYEYVQNITLVYDLTEICDTLPWTSPVGNCESGHTLNDDVEWPADITIHKPFSKPEDLMQNGEVHPKSVRPQLMTGCNAAEVTYSDVVTAINDMTLLVERTWVVRDVPSSQTWPYVQRITIKRDGDGSLICVNREQGQAIPNVQLISSIQTDVTGCYFFENPEGVVVVPVKDESLREGVNINDQIAIREYILGMRTFSEYQRYAADLNEDGVINSADIVAIDQILDGTFIPPFPHSWKFYEVLTNDSFADISSTLVPYYFIGVKMGDVITADEEEIMYLSAADEVLNEGEVYEIPFYLDRNAVARGCGIRFSSPGHALEFLDVTAPQIPDFNQGSFHITPDFLSIIWIASPPYFGSGVNIRSDLPLFILRLKANENIILHEAISLSTNFLHEFITTGPKQVFILLLYWGKVIVSSTLDLDNGRKLEIYPNPVTNEMHITGLTDLDDGQMTLFDNVGQIVLRSPLQETVDMTTLHPGIYYVSVFVDGTYSKAVPVIKVQH